MLEVWGRRNSLNVQKVMWTIGELGLECVRHDVGGQFGKTDTPEYDVMNPNRKVPTVIDDGFVLWESNACVRYLAEKYGPGTLAPVDAQNRAVADQWMDWMATTLYPAMFVPFMSLLRMPAEARDHIAFDADVILLGELYQLLDAHLDSHSYVAGEAFSMGDIPLGCATWRYYNLEINRPILPNVQAWYARLLERPAYQKHVAFPPGTTPAEWNALELAGAGK